MGGGNKTMRGSMSPNEQGMLRRAADRSDVSPPDTPTSTIKQEYQASNGACRVCVSSQRASHSEWHSTCLK